MKKCFVLLFSSLLPSLTLAATIQSPLSKVAGEYLNLLQNEENLTLLDQASIPNADNETLVQLCLSDNSLGLISTATNACLLSNGRTRQSHEFMPLLPDVKSTQLFYEALLQLSDKSVEWQWYKNSGKLCYRSNDSVITDICLIPGSRHQDFAGSRDTRQIIEMNTTNGTETDMGNGTILCCEPNPNADDSSFPVVPTVVTTVLGGLLFVGIVIVTTAIGIIIHKTRNLTH
ncbi:hypothetical protein [Endozoicomonas arenosclerae]|uniref:hypothetical protein n=1 Tax=Endozoicomonas arenosclerae TaxID=1633495 RepID=UPI0007806E7F|nr:hypothetical protein [Endozoicomonas arenosclerae]